MEMMQWSESFNVGVHIVDEQHRQLFALVNDLIGAIRTGQRREDLDRVLQAVLAYTETHFRMEEELLKLHPSFEKHRAIHGAFAAEMKLRAENLANGEGVDPEEFLERLVRWLKNHILQTDIAYFGELGFRPREMRENIEERLHLLTQKVKVLVVEDSPTQRLFLRSSLEEEGFDVLEAGDGAEALRLLETSPDLHLVVTDLAMPGLDGYGLIRSIRDKGYPSVYIIVTTSSTGKKALVKSFQAGANDFLTKPVFHPELHLRLRNGMNLLRLETQDELIFSMAKLADQRSPETGRHLDRVQIFTRILARRVMESNPDLGMTESIASEIARFSPLHDIGKVAIADAVLNKPGKLDPDEFRIMQEHARIGGDLLSALLRKTASRSLRIAYELTMFHHEKWDGTGYPLGLAGTDIPVSARILAVADVYDAVSSDRIYRAAMTREEARDLILRGSGTHFDPRVAAAFEALEAEFHGIREELRD